MDIIHNQSNNGIRINGNIISTVYSTLEDLMLQAYNLGLSENHLAEEKVLKQCYKLSKIPYSNNISETIKQYANLKGIKL